MSNSGTVSLGSWVRVKDAIYEEEEFYRIAEKSEPRENKISPETALGEALVGASVGDEVSVHGPAGTVKFVVLDVGKDE